jgi:hypothetical protein
LEIIVTTGLYRTIVVEPADPDYSHVEAARPEPVR